jgi:alpha-glucan,water dikinase
VVGAKAYNLAKLRSTLPSDVRVPSSVAVPFGVFEAVMAHPANAGPAAQLAKLQAELGNARVSGGDVGVWAAWWRGTGGRGEP